MEWIGSSNLEESETRGPRRLPWSTDLGFFRAFRVFRGFRVFRVFRGLGFRGFGFRV